MAETDWAGVYNVGRIRTNGCSFLHLLSDFGEEHLVKEIPCSVIGDVVVVEIHARYMLHTSLILLFSTRQ